MLGPQTVNGIALGSNFPSIRACVDLIEDGVHTGKVTPSSGAAAVTSYNEQAMYTAQCGSVDACVAAGGTKRGSAGATAGTCDNTTTRNLGVNAKANAATQICPQQTWARPNLINAPGASTINPSTGHATYAGAPAPSYFNTLKALTNETTMGLSNVAAFAGIDGSGGITGIIPVGQAFLTAVQTGVATRNMYASDALSDNLIDLGFNDGTHASVTGSYLRALTNFGSITGLDPALFDAREIAARELGLSECDARLLQQVASLQLGFPSSVPEPGSMALVALALVALVLLDLAGLRWRAAPAPWPR